MKLNKLITVLALFSFAEAIGQNNSYPTTGDVKIFAGSSSWGEGVAVVRPSGWSGFRITRNDPLTGNYSGNWALGYTASTGNDFSISTNYNGTQYDGLFHISNSTRNIGIGTLNPGSKLHVVDGIPSSAQGLNSLTKFAVDASNGGYTEFRSTQDNNTYSGLLFTDNNLGGYLTFRNYPDDKLHIGAYGGIAFEVGTDNNVGGKAERLRIDSNGNLGLGTVSPSAPLHIRSSGYGSHFTIETNANGQGDLQWFQGGTASANQRAALQINEVTGDFEAWTFNNTVWQKGLLINRLSNNIGIGTSSPTQKLTVNGTIYGKEVKVDLSVPGPDYVFANNYQLLTLNELKTYIDQHKHLPEVPSAKEMEKNGIQLGEMNMLLLKKMEEMTLYMIDLKKENDLLKTRIEKIENRK